MKTHPLVSIVMLTRDSSKAVKMALASVYAQDYPDIEIIVVDNGSREILARYLKVQSEERGIRVLFNGMNMGACIGRNQGAALSAGEYILFLDSDAVLVNKDTISRAVEEIMRHENIGAMGGIAFADEQLSKIEHSIMRFEEGKMADCACLKHIPSETDFSVDYIQSDFLIIPREALNRTGGFDPFYFFYYEDTDLSFRAKNRGYRLAVTPKVTFCHRFAPRRTEITHDSLYKTLYLYVKNVSLLKGLQYFLRSMFEGAGRIRKASRPKACFLALWYSVCWFFLAWLVVFLPLARLRNRMNFITGGGMGEKSTRAILRFPLALERKCLAAAVALLFWIKKKRGKRGLFLFVTDRCTQACAHCLLGEDTGRGKEELTVPEIRKTYNSLRKQIGGVAITGGEPFLRDDIVDICGVFQVPPCVSGISLNTNGFSPALIRNNVDRILSNAPESQEIAVIVSLNGMEKLHDGIAKERSV